ncbi:MAG: DUF2922 domain-containing protein [Defluviitaleaceae bacterium]|nr:DUF2922 domain-containing protein [Defluviitaleaceae bacterium]
MTHYSMVFNTLSGSRRSLRIINPNPNLPVETISAAVDKMIANDIFDPAKSGLDSLNRMELTTISTTAIL